MERISIRWQLPLTYAGIALMTTLALGLVLLTVLRGHYANQERLYLQNNAQVISSLLTNPVANNSAQAELRARVRSLSFLSESRIILRNPDGRIIVDSGSPAISLIAFSPAIGRSTNPPPDDYDSPLIPGSPSWTATVRLEPIEPQQLTVDPSINNDSIYLFDAKPSDLKDLPMGEETEYPIARIRAIENIEPSIPMANVVQVFRTPFGLNINDNFVFGQLSHRRSDQIGESVIRDARGDILGYVQLSDGPAYGLEIIDSVAQSWLIATVVAVCLAAIAGWFMSLRLTEPLLSLTMTTIQMARGDLSARTAIQRQDELGTLASVFNDMAERIESTVVMLRRFVADAAHELNTPLTALRTNLELLRESYDPKATRRALDQIIRLEALAGDLLDLSRLEAKADPRPHRLLNLVDLVRESSEIHGSRAEQAELEFELNLPSHSIHVMGDKGQLQRLLSNLFDNAIKFTPRGGCITLQVGVTDNNAVLTIADSGIGIPSDDLPFLFERFRRGRNTADYPGSGLGLAIVKAIADSHHGFVYAENTHHGARFTVTLPVAG